MRARWYALLMTCFSAPTALAPASSLPPTDREEARAVFTLWFVDDNDEAAAQAGAEPPPHVRLVRILHEAGFQARIDHVRESDFPARWTEAEESGRLPQMLAVKRWRGRVPELERAGAFQLVRSERLTFDPSSCPDLANRFQLLPRGASGGSTTRELMKILLDPGKTRPLPGPGLATEGGRLEAAQAARRAVAAYLSGDADRLRVVASRRSSQLRECTVPARWLDGMRVQTEDVQLRGNARLAAAVVEASFESERFLCRDPVAVILVREEGRWKALTVCRDFATVRDAVPALCLAFSQVRSGGDASPPEPLLQEPPDGGDLSASRPRLIWSVPPAGGPILAQVFEQHFGDLADKEARWPEARLQVFPPRPRNGAVNPYEGVVGGNMSWTVWTLGQGGEIAVAPARRFGLGR